MDNKISVIIPIYNSENTLQQCLQSIFNNTYKNFEVIVVDDVSTDKSCAIAKQFQCKLINLTENRGPAYARQAGVASAKGDIIAFFDSDCIAPKDWLEKINSKLSSDIAGIGGKYILPDHINKWSKPFITYWDIKNILFRKPRKTISLYGGNSAFWRIKLLEQRKKSELAYCNKKVGGDDTLLCYEIEKFGPLIYDPDIYVIHDKNMPFKKVLKETITLGYSGSMVAGVCGKRLLKEPQRAYKTFLNIFSVLLAGLTIILPFYPNLIHPYLALAGLYIITALPLMYFTHKHIDKSYRIIFMPFITFISDILHFSGLCIQLKDKIKEKLKTLLWRFRFIINILNQKSLSRIILFVTKRCNAACDFCFNKNTESANTDELSINEIEQITKNIRFLPWLTISGGEPFLRKDLFRICTLFYENSSTRKITIVTNGSLPSAVETTIEKAMLDAPGLNMAIAVAFDHIENEHDKIKGLDGCYEKAAETLKKLNDLKNRFGNRITIGINTIINNENADKITDISEHLTNTLKYDYHVFNPLRIAPCTPASAGLIDNTSYLKLIKQTNLKLMPKKSTLLKRNTHNAFLNECCEATINAHSESYKPCFAVRKFLVQNNDGNVFPCELIQESMGNIRENKYDMRSIQNNKQSKHLINKIKDKKCYCQWPCAVTSNTLFNIKSYPRIIKKIFST